MKKCWCGKEMIRIEGYRDRDTVVCQCPDRYLDREKEHDSCNLSYIEAGIDGKNTFSVTIKTYFAPGILESRYTAFVDPDATVKWGDYVAVRDKSGEITEKYFTDTLFENTLGKIVGRVRESLIKSVIRHQRYLSFLEEKNFKNLSLERGII